MPAFAALVSEPLSSSLTQSSSGHLGTDPLGLLAVAGTVVQTVVDLCFLPRSSVPRRQ